MSTRLWDYPSEPIGGGNPYYRCISCKLSAPEINGKIDGHHPWCEFRKKAEAEMSGQPPTTMWRSMDSAPKDGTVILAVLNDSDIAHSVKWDPMPGAWIMVWDWYELSKLDGPRCWMPIPPITGV